MHLRDSGTYRRSCHVRRRRGPPTTAPSPAAAPTPSPSPALTQEQIRAEAAAAYLAAVRPYNKELTRLWKLYKDKTTLKAARAYCVKLDANLRKWIASLQEITFPEETKADVKQLIRWGAAEDAQLRSCAVSKNLAAWSSAWLKADKNRDVPLNTRTSSG